MNKLLLTIFFVMFCSTAFADHWVYIRLEDRVATTTEDTAGRSKRGDIVDIRYADYIPSEREQDSYAIVRVTGLDDATIEEYKKSWEDENGPIAYRRYRLKKQWIKNMTVGIYPQTINVSIVNGNIELKTEQDLIVYEWKTKFYAYVQRPIKLAFRRTDDYWVKYAYALTEDSCGSATAEREVVCTVNKTGQDYDTLTLWEDALDDDLVTAQQIQRADVYDDDGDLDDDLLISGATSSSSYYMKVTAPVGERHNGTASTGATLLGNLNNTRALGVFNDYAVVEWLVVNYTGTNQSCVAFGGDPGVVVRNMIFESTQGVGDVVQVIFTTAAATGTLLYNNIIVECPNANGVDIDGNNAGSIGIYNNTVYGCGGYGYYSDGAQPVITIKNNIAYNNTGDDYSANWDTTSNNLSEDATSPDAAYQSKSLTFANAAGGDFHLVVGDTDAIDDGADLSGTFSNDIDNDTRSGTWDIGADEYVSLGRSRRFF